MNMDDKISDMFVKIDELLEEYSTPDDISEYDFEEDRYSAILELTRERYNNLVALYSNAHDRGLYYVINRSAYLRCLKEVFDVMKQDIIEFNNKSN